MANNDIRDVVITRVLNAPVATVWNLWTDPNAVTGWWGPEDYTSPSALIDLREGGSYLFAMRAPADQGGAVSYTGGVYKRIEPLKRLEFTQNLTNECPPTCLNWEYHDDHADARGTPHDHRTLDPNTAPLAERASTPHRHLGAARSLDRKR